MKITDWYSVFMSLRMTSLLVLVAGVCTISSADSSAADEELKSVFKSHSQMKGLVVFQRFMHSSGETSWELDGMYDLCRSGNAFRLEYNGFFGDMSRWICDGKSILVDAFGDEVELRLAPKEIWKFQDGSRTEDNGGLLVQVLGGDAAFDAVVKPDSVKKTVIGNQVQYEFQHQYDAKCRIFVEKGAIVAVEYDTQGFSFFGENKVTYRDQIVWRNEAKKFDKNWFSVKPEPGRTVVDLRPPL